MHASSSQNFGTVSIYEDAPETDEKAPQDDDEDIEVEDEDEKVKNAGKKMRLEEVWREMMVTSYGRDKIFVSYLNNYLRNVNGMMDIPLPLPYCRTETDSILNTAGTMVPLFINEQQTPSEANTTAMGAGHCFTTNFHCSRIVTHKVCFQRPIIIMVTHQTPFL